MIIEGSNWNYQAALLTSGRAGAPRALTSIRDIHGKLVLTSFWRLGQIVESHPTNVMRGDDVLQTARW